MIENFIDKVIEKYIVDNIMNFMVFIIVFFGLIFNFNLFNIDGYGI